MDAIAKPLLTGFGCTGGYGGILGGILLEKFDSLLLLNEYPQLGHTDMLYSIGFLQFGH